jgi:uncharacterized protein YndB with AHSA1/START domain
MDPKILLTESIYEAPIEKVWEALTDKDKMKDWYFEVSDFKAEVGFEFQFYGESKDKKYLHKCTIVEVEPFRKISYTWSYDGYAGQSLVTFELLNEGINLTRVKLSHSGLDTFPSDNPDFEEKNFKQGWNTILGDLLRNYVEK